MKTFETAANEVERGELSPSLPLAYREVWTLKPRRRPSSYLRVALGFALSVLVWSAAILSLIIVAAFLR